MTSMQRSERHFSMLRDFRAADFVTLLNGVAGTAAIFALIDHCMSGKMSMLWLGAALMLVALLMDIADGRIARVRNESSAVGRELDSLADVVSFGVAPAVLGYAYGFRGGWDLLCLILFVACGISRLARYNVTASALSDASGKVRYYEGLPIPSSLLLAGLLIGLSVAGYARESAPLGVVQLGPASFHPLAALYLLHGFAMISKTLRIPKP
jgi:CDP-diacylglycerol---serine O-phosphatidyltransferase